MKSIPNFPNYFADKQGNIWSKKTGKLKKLKSVKHKRGYLRITLHKNRKRYVVYVHKLILETFVGPCPEGYWARHLDGIKINNKYSNLKWDTPKKNCLDRIKHGTQVYPKGEKHGRSKLTDLKVIRIKELLEQGELTQEQIAKRFNVSRPTISLINIGYIWKHLN